LFGLISTRITGGHPSLLAFKPEGVGCFDLCSPSKGVLWINYSQCAFRGSAIFKTMPPLNDATASFALMDCNDMTYGVVVMANRAANHDIVCFWLFVHHLSLTQMLKPIRHALISAIAAAKQTAKMNSEKANC
jgi:hypothetical protein